MTCENPTARNGSARRPCAPKEDNAPPVGWIDERHLANRRHGSLSVLLRWNEAHHVRRQEVAIPGKELGKYDFTKSRTAARHSRSYACLVDVRVSNLETSPPINLWRTCPRTLRKSLGLYPRKGAFVPGADADVVIWDPEKKLKYGVAHSHQRTDYNFYEGWDIMGYPEKVFLRGKLIVDGRTQMCTALACLRALFVASSMM
jgi:hypothetical protein